MAVETATNINQLDPLLPAASDGKSEGDNHIRLVKATLKTTFNGITGISISPVSNSDEVLATTSQVASAISLAKASIADGAELASNKDATGGYAGLTLFKLNLKNAANTFTNFITNATTAARTWTMPDKDGTVAMTSDMPDPLAGFRNRIINGDMRIDQRNAGSAQTITAAAALVYTVDRFYAYCTGANVTGQQVAGADQTQKRYRFTGAASVTAIGFGTRLEARNTYDLNSQTVTIAADLANSLLTTVTWTLYRATTTDDTFGSLASPTVTQIATGTFTVNSTVARYSTQVSVPAAATTGLQLVLSVGAQTSGTWTIGNVQLELGSTATTFEQRPYGAELDLCKRYYEKSYAYAEAPGTLTLANARSSTYCAASSYTTTNAGYLEKRASPTYTYWDGAGNLSRVTLINGTTAAQTNNLNFLATSLINPSAGWLRFILSTTTGSCMFHFTADAEL